MFEQVLSASHPEQVSAVALSPDGTLLASSTFEATYLWNREGRLVREFEGDGYALAFAPDGTLAVGGNRRTALWEVLSGTQLATLEPFGNSVEGVAFSADGSLLATASHDGTLKVFPTRPLSLQRRILTQQWKVLQSFCLGNWVNTVAFHPRQDRLAVGSRDGTLRVWDPWNARQLFLFEGEAFDRWPVRVCYSPRGLMLASGWSDGSIQLFWNLDHSEAGDLRGHEDWVCSLTFLDEQHLVSGSHDGKMALWDLKHKKVLHSCSPHEERPVYDISSWPGSPFFLTGGWDNQLRLWRTDL